MSSKRQKRKREDEPIREQENHKRSKRDPHPKTKENSLVDGESDAHTDKGSIKMEKHSSSSADVKKETRITKKKRGNEECGLRKEPANCLQPKCDDKEEEEEDEPEDDTSIDLDSEDSMDSEMTTEDREQLQGLFRRITKGFGDEFTLDSDALECLEEMTEAFVTGFFEDINMFAQRKGRATVKVEDISSFVKLRLLNLPDNEGDSK